MCCNFREKNAQTVTKLVWGAVPLNVKQCAISATCLKQKQARKQQQQNCKVGVCLLWNMLAVLELVQPPPHKLS